MVVVSSADVAALSPYEADPPTVLPSIIMENLPTDYIKVFRFEVKAVIATRTFCWKSLSNTDSLNF